jgi:branched-chain amino acid aminotransferase
MKEVKEASYSGSLVELFGAGDFSILLIQLAQPNNGLSSGTAAVISPVDRIGYLGEDIPIPIGEDGMGPVSRPIWTELVGRQTGAIPSDWSVLVTE